MGMMLRRRHEDKPKAKAVEKAPEPIKVEKPEPKEVKKSGSNKQAKT